MAALSNSRGAGVPSRTPRIGYGCDPSYMGPPTHLLIKSDGHGTYIREAIELTTGNVMTDADGAVIYDQITYPTRGHLTVVAKGWRLLRLVER